MFHIRPELLRQPPLSVPKDTGKPLEQRVTVKAAARTLNTTYASLDKTDNSVNALFVKTIATLERTSCAWRENLPIKKLHSDVKKIIDTCLEELFTLLILTEQESSYEHSDQIKNPFVKEEFEKLLTTHQTSMRTYMGTDSAPLIKKQFQSDLKDFYKKGFRQILSEVRGELTPSEEKMEVLMTLEGSEDNSITETSALLDGSRATLPVSPGDPKRRTSEEQVGPSHLDGVATNPRVHSIELSSSGETRHKKEVFRVGTYSAHCFGFFETNFSEKKKTLTFMINSLEKGDPSSPLLAEKREELEVINSIETHVTNRIKEIDEEILKKNEELPTQPDERTRVKAGIDPADLEPPTSYKRALKEIHTLEEEKRALLISPRDKKGLIAKLLKGSLKTHEGESISFSSEAAKRVLGLSLYTLRRDIEGLKECLTQISPSPGGAFQAALDQEKEQLSAHITTLENKFNNRLEICEKQAVSMIYAEASHYIEKLVTEGKLEGCETYGYSATPAFIESQEGKAFLEGNWLHLQHTLVQTKKLELGMLQDQVETIRSLRERLVFSFDRNDGITDLENTPDAPHSWTIHLPKLTLPSPSEDSPHLLSRRKQSMTILLRESEEEISEETIRTPYKGVIFNFNMNDPSSNNTPYHTEITRSELLTLLSFLSTEEEKEGFLKLVKSEPLTDVEEKSIESMKTKLTEDLFNTLKKLYESPAEIKQEDLLKIGKYIDSMGGTNTVSCKSAKDRTQLHVVKFLGQLMAESQGTPPLSAIKLEGKMLISHVGAEIAEENIGTQGFKWKPHLFAQAAKTVVAASRSLRPLSTLNSFMRNAMSAST